MAFNIRKTSPLGVHVVIKFSSEQCHAKEHRGGDAQFGLQTSSEYAGYNRRSKTAGSPSSESAA